MISFFMDMTHIHLTMIDIDKLKSTIQIVESISIHSVLNLIVRKQNQSFCVGIQITIVRVNVQCLFYQCLFHCRVNTHGQQLLKIHQLRWFHAALSHHRLRQPLHGVSSINSHSTSRCYLDHSHQCTALSIDRSICISIAHIEHSAQFQIIEKLDSVCRQSLYVIFKPLKL